MQLSTIFAFLVAAQDQTPTVAASTTLAAETVSQPAAGEPTMAAESTTQAAESTQAAEGAAQAAEGATQAMEEDKDKSHEGDDAAADDAVNAVKGEQNSEPNGEEDMDMEDAKKVVLVITEDGDKKALGASSSMSREEFNERVRRHNELVRQFNQMQREQNKKLQKFNRQVRILNKTWICLKTVSVNKDAARGAADNCAQLHFKAVNKYITKLFAYRQGQKALKDFHKQIKRSRNELRFGPNSMKVKDADTMDAEDAVKEAAMRADAAKLNKELDALVKAVEKENAGYDAEEDEEEDADMSFAPALIGSFLALL